MNKPWRPRHLPLNPVQLAISQAGGPVHCAQMLGMSLRSVYLWMRRGDMRGVAAELVLQLAAESGVSPENLVGRVGRWPIKPMASPRRRPTE